jgi:hypothetical protein
MNARENLIKIESANGSFWLDLSGCNFGSGSAATIWRVAYLARLNRSLCPKNGLESAVVGGDLAGFSFEDGRPMRTMQSSAIHANLSSVANSVAGDLKKTKGLVATSLLTLVIDGAAGRN